MKGTAATLISVLLLPGPIGCWAPGSRASPPPMPDPGTARAALVLALQGWAGRGDRAGRLDGVRVELADRRYAEGSTPEGFAVLGAVREDWGRGFVVRLDWGDEESAETATYVVAGSDPIWVMRRDDIDLLMHWEHPMESTASGEPGASKPAGSGGGP